MNDDEENTNLPDLFEDPERPKKGEHLIVNKAVYVSALKAMAALMEQSADYFQMIKSSDHSKEAKQISMQILSENIRALQMISQGFESSMYEPIVTENKHLN